MMSNITEHCNAGGRAWTIHGLTSWLSDILMNLFPGHANALRVRVLGLSAVAGSRDFDLLEERNRDGAEAVRMLATGRGCDRWPLQRVRSPGIFANDRAAKPFNALTWTPLARCEPQGWLTEFCWVV